MPKAADKSLILLFSQQKVHMSMLTHMSIVRLIWKCPWWSGSLIHCPLGWALVVLHHLQWAHLGFLLLIWGAVQLQWEHCFQDGLFLITWGSWLQHPRISAWSLWRQRWSPESQYGVSGSYISSGLLPLPFFLGQNCWHEPTQTCISNLVYFVYLYTKFWVGLSRCVITARGLPQVKGIDISLLWGSQQHSTNPYRMQLSPHRCYCIGMCEIG